MHRCGAGGATEHADADENDDIMAALRLMQRKDAAVQEDLPVGLISAPLCEVAALRPVWHPLCAARTCQTAQGEPERASGAGGRVGADGRLHALS